MAEEADRLCAVREDISKGEGILQRGTNCILIFQLLCVFGLLFFSEHLVRLAFQCLQLVVTDFLPLMPWGCLPLTVDTAAKFGSQTQELNISLTAIGLMVRKVKYFD